MLHRIRFCQICGSIGAYLTKLYATKKRYMAYLCNECDKSHLNYLFNGRTKLEILNKFRESPLVFNGPKSGAYMKDRSDFGVLYSCKKCFRRYSIQRIYFFDDGYIVPPELKKLKKFGLLCEECVIEIIREFVINIPLNQLALYTPYNKIRYEGEDGITESSDDLNEKVVYFVIKRFYGIDITENPSLNHGDSMLNLSIEYLSFEDYQMTLKDADVEVDEKEKRMGLKNVNPFVIAHDEHGLIISVSIFSSITKVALLSYGYSEVFYDIFIRAISSGYTYIHFDSVGPRYKEFDEIIKGKYK